MLKTNIDIRIYIKNIFVYLKIEISVFYYKHFILFLYISTFYILLKSKINFTDCRHYLRKI